MAVAFDEMNGPGGDLRPAYQELSRWLKETPPDALEYRRQEAELLFRRIGITFAVYGDAEAQERLIPFDVIPRIMSAKEWTLLEKGLKQRVRALNMFLRDIYHGRDILRANIIPDDLIFQNPVFRPEMNGQDVPHDVYVHIAGIDIVRVDAGQFHRAGGQCAHPVRRVLHAGKPRNHDAAVSGSVRPPPRRAGGEISGRTAVGAALGGAALAPPPSRRSR